MLNGFFPFAAPTARALLGSPSCGPVRRSSSSGRTGMVRSTIHADCWNGVPTGSSGRSNSRRVPAKYSSSWRTAWSSNGVVPSTSSSSSTEASPHSVFGAPQDGPQAALAGDDAQVADRRIHGGGVQHVVLLHRLAQRWWRAYERHGRHDSASVAAAFGVRFDANARSALRTPMSVGRKTSGSPRARIAT